MDQFLTRRATSPALEEKLFNQIPMLDHGYLMLVDYMGNEESIITSARTSYGKGTKTISEDIGLLRYLMRHHHTTPFEMAEIKFQVKLPIFVARQWIRHRMASVNEVSARYSILDKEFYIPAAEHLTPQSKDNKQGRSDEQLTPAQAIAVQRLLKEDAEQVYADYLALLHENPDDTPSLNWAGIVELDELKGPEFPGIARELARMGLSLNYYTTWIWKTDVHNLMHFLGLRADKHAQYEVRVYAETILDMLAMWMPNVHQAFMDYRKNAFTLSGPMIHMLRALLPVSRTDFEEQAKHFNLTKRELAEFMQMIHPPAG